MAATTVAAHGASPLRADELLLVYNRDDPRSRELAEYYARARSVPADRLCPVRAVVNDEEMARHHFDRYVRPAIRSHLESHDFGRQIRCLVLFYGLPIRIGPKLARPAEQRLARQWQTQLQKATARLAELTAAMEDLAGETPAASETQPAPAEESEQSLNALLGRYQRARVAAGKRIDALHREGQGQEAFTKAMAITQAVEGANRVLAIAAAAANLASNDAAQIEKAVEQLRLNEARIKEVMAKALTDPAREEGRRLILQNHGVLGQIKSLNADIARTRTDETAASLDSELALVWWDDYVLYRWIPNTLSWRVRANPAALASLPASQRELPVLMTARIDGPTMAVAQRLIDDAIAVEKTGLAGAVCLDARGLEDDEGFVDYDGGLRELAGLLARETDLPVKLDNESALFGPGDCPNTALYCGWYSLRRYINAFQFVRGAVGYHLASFEAVSIKAAGERGWVRGLLDSGVAATVGSVAEPYLQAFPRPQPFFGLLMTGQFTLAECYAYTSDFNSWMMLLIGDPLYRPFAANPQLKLEQVFASKEIPPEYAQ